MSHNLRDVLLPLSIFFGFGGSIYFFTKLMTNYILKKKMIDKGYVNDDTQAIFKEHTVSADNRYPSLKWGLIILFAGLALIIMEYIPASPESPLPYGLFAVFVSAGFLIYYFLVKNEIKNK